MKPFLRIGWTLNYEMYFYSCVWVSLLATKKHSLMCAIILVLMMYIIFGNIFVNAVAKEFFGSELVFEFALGILAYLIYIQSILNKYSNVIFILSAILSYILMVIIELNGFTTHRLIAFGLPSFLLLISAVNLESVISESKNKILDFAVSMGDASYATYLTHWYVIVAFRKIVSTKLGFFDSNTLLGVTITFVFALVIGQLTFKLADKPFHIYLKKLFISKFTIPTQHQINSNLTDQLLTPIKYASYVQLDVPRDS